MSWRYSGIATHGNCDIYTHELSEKDMGLEGDETHILWRQDMGLVTTEPISP